SQLDTADAVVAFSVIDTGVGIPANKQNSIFEPFQQADGTTSRQYGGTGLGLSISRELTRLLGGEIRVSSAPGKGCTFTLYLPLGKERAPDAITLDLLLPDMDGWAMLDLLKHDPVTRHIPVNVISVSDQMNRCMHMGALGVVQKPAAKEALQEALARTRKFVDREVKTLLVAYGDTAQREGISEALRTDGVKITGVGS